MGVFVTSRVGSAISEPFGNTSECSMTLVVNSPSFFLTSGTI